MYNRSDKMLMPKKDLTAIYEYLFKEGVMVAKKDFNSPHHPALRKVPNLHVIKAMQSLKSRGYVKEQFAWRHYYWYLTNPGIQYLRDYLHLPPEIVPPTLKRSAGKVPDGTGRPDRPDRMDGDKDQRRPDDGYRRGPGGFSDGGMRSGFGRGRPAAAPEAE